jgi:hypothetical protein
MREPSLTSEVRAQRLRTWQRSLAGSLAGGRRPSLPSDAVLRWFLASNGWALDKRGRVVLAVGGRLGTLDPRWVARRWAEWSRAHDWQALADAPATNRTESHLFTGRSSPCR